MSKSRAVHDVLALKKAVDEETVRVGRIIAERVGQKSSRTMGQMSISVFGHRLHGLYVLRYHLSELGWRAKVIPAETKRLIQQMMERPPSGRYLHDHPIHLLYSGELPTGETEQANARIRKIAGVK